MLMERPLLHCPLYTDVMYSKWLLVIICPFDFCPGFSSIDAFHSSDACIIDKAICKTSAEKTARSC
jgi:hypothetical protein